MPPFTSPPAEVQPRPASPRAAGLRLAHSAEAATLDAAGGAAWQPVTSPTDPRWVLAVRAAEALEGSVLLPPRREGLLRLARVLGLTPFDAALILATVQDRARRGHVGAQCAHAAAEQLAMVTLRTTKPPLRLRVTLAAVALLTMAEAAGLVWWWTQG